MPWGESDDFGDSASRRGRSSGALDDGVCEEDSGDGAETEHIRLLKFVRDTQVWSSGKRYCEMRAEGSWTETMDNLASHVSQRAQEIRMQEGSLEAGRFEHLDREFQDRVHSLRAEENTLKARLRERAQGDENLERCCIAMRRQRKPIRQHIHRTVLLRYIHHITPVVVQVTQLLQAEDVTDGEGEDPRVSAHGAPSGSTSAMAASGSAGSSNHGPHKLRPRDDDDDDAYNDDEAEAAAWRTSVAGGGGGGGGGGSGGVSSPPALPSNSATLRARAREASQPPSAPSDASAFSSRRHGRTASGTSVGSGVLPHAGVEAFGGPPVGPGDRDRDGGGSGSARRLSSTGPGSASVDSSGSRSWHPPVAPSGSGATTRVGAGVGQF